MEALYQAENGLSLYDGWWVNTGVIVVVVCHRPALWVVSGAGGAQERVWLRESVCVCVCVI